ncbi:MAG TPA: hypothetical protein DDY31_01575 [Lachnospiraceae bacterium]|nr:hypothetical protein [Lachnospiraceae bacterium]
MDKNVLIQYADMQQEVKDIRRRIDEIERNLNRMIESKEMVSDTVKGTRKDGTIGAIKITGFPDQEYSKKSQSLKRLKAKLEQTEEELLEMMTDAEEFIESIEDSELRTMFRLHYIDDLTWNQTAHRMNSMFSKRVYTEDSCRKKNERFFKKI